MFTVIQTGTIAAVAVAFRKFSAYLFPALNDAAPLFQSGEFKITWIQILGIAGDFVAHLHQYSRCRKRKLLQNIIHRF